MNINPHDDRPIFLQIKEGIEIGIVSGTYPEGSQIPSTTELSLTYNINPATALKGINGLVDENILYKKRGIGVFVVEGAGEEIKKKRQDSFKKTFIDPLLEEARRLGIQKEEILTWIRETKIREESGHE